MKDRDSVHIIRHFFKSMIRNAGKMMRSFTEEPIHLFRVDYKKTRAFLRMMRTNADHPGQMKFPNELKKMYCGTGKIRDAQLSLKRFKESFKTRGKLSRIKIQSIQKEIKDLTNKNIFLSKRNLEEIEKHILKVPSIDSPGKQVKHFFKQKLKVINEIAVRGDFKDTDLHSIRKCFKDIIYIARIFRDDLKKPIPFHFWNEGDFKKAESLTHKLGLFNDSCILLTYLSPADIRKADVLEKEQLKMVRRKWLRKKTRLKRAILSELTAINLAITA